MKVHLSDKLRLGLSLLSLRLGVAAVFLVWAIDRVTNYAHNSRVVKHYYKLDVSPDILTTIGILQLLLILAFITGYKKFWTYGSLLLLHSGTTIASFHRLIPPFERHQLLYYGAIPMLAACLTLFLLRKHDYILTLPQSKSLTADQTK